jgi:hypothetical protein
MSPLKKYLLSMKTERKLQGRVVKQVVRQEKGDTSAFNDGVTIMIEAHIVPSFIHKES